MTKFMDAGRALLAAFGRKAPALPASPNWEALAGQWQTLYNEQEALCATQKAEYEAAMKIAGAQAQEQATQFAELEQKYTSLEASYKRATDSWFEEKRKRETLQSNYQTLVEATQLEHGRAEVDAATIARMEKEKWELVEVLAGRERAMKALTEQHGKVLAAKQIAEEVQQSQSEVISTQQQGLLDYERDTRKLQDEMAALTREHNLVLAAKRAAEDDAAEYKQANEDAYQSYDTLKKLAGRALSLLLHPIGLHQPWPHKRDVLAAEMKEAGIQEPKPEPENG